MKPLHLFLAFGVIGFFVQNAVAQRADLVGRKVMTIKRTEFRVPGKTVGTADVGDIFTVDQVKDEWLWIPSRKGWVDSADVIPVERAVNFFSSIAKNKPTAVNIFLRGMAKYRLQNYYGAIEDFNLAIRMKEDGFYYNARGETWRQLNDLDRAIADFDASMKLDAKQPIPHNNRGLAWQAKGDLKKAIEDFDKALELAPRFALAYYNRGIANRLLKEHDLAIADFNEALALDPQDVESYNARGTVWAAKDEFSKALQDYNEALRLAPRLTSAYFNRGLVHVALHRFGAAMADYRKAISLNEKYARAYNGIAWLMATCPEESIRNGKRAVEYAEMARKYSDQVDSAYVGTMAAAVAEVGDFKRAIELVKQAIEEDPELYPETRQEMLAAFEKEEPFRKPESAH